MAIDKKLIHFQSKNKFEEKNNAGEILDSSIVFVKDSNEIYTHGEEYQFVGWSKLIPPKQIITFSILSVIYQAEEGMTWGDWINSNYNTDGYYITKNNKIKNSTTYDYIYDSTLHDTTGVYSIDIIWKDHKYSSYGGSTGD